MVWTVGAEWTLLGEFGLLAFVVVLGVGDVGDEVKSGVDQVMDGGEEDD